MPGFLGLLALLFIGLKLGGVIAWSWFWVLSPLWALIPVLIVMFMICVAVESQGMSRSANAATALSQGLKP